MADVFISFSQQDAERVREVAERLATLGYSVQAGDGQTDLDAVERDIDAARAVLAVWSENTASSVRVFGEALRALDAGKLLQMRLDAAAPPPPFDALGCADMSGARPEWGPLEDALHKLVRGGERIADGAAVPGWFAVAPALGAPRLLAIAAAIALAAQVGAASSAYYGVMRPDQLQVALLGVFGVSGVCAALSLFRLLAVARAGG